MGPVDSTIARLALPHDAAGVVRDYLARVAGALPPIRRLRRGVLAELGDGIACAVESRVAAGERPVDAARAAVAELGRPAAIAAALTAELAPLSAHRTGLMLLVGGPVVGVAWIAAGSPTLDWWDRVEQALRAVPAYPVLLALAVPAALVAVVGAGPLCRRWPRLGSASVLAALCAGLACVAGDALLLAWAGSAMATNPWLLTAVAASAIRLILAASAVHRVARLRAAGRQPVG
jgi:hypothetical protein